MDVKSMDMKLMDVKIDKKLLRKARRQPVSAKAVVMADDKVLLLRQPNGKWDLPGGKVEADEEVTDGLVREVLEETDIRVEPKQFLHAQTRTRKDDGDLLVLSFLCRPKSVKKKRKSGRKSGRKAEHKSVRKLAEKHITLSDEHDDFALVSLKKACRRDMPARHKSVLKAAARHLGVAAS